MRFTFYLLLVSIRFSIASIPSIDLSDADDEDLPTFQVSQIPQTLFQANNSDSDPDNNDYQFLLKLVKFHLHLTEPHTKHTLEYWKQRISTAKPLLSTSTNAFRNMVDRLVFDILQIVKTSEHDGFYELAFETDAKRGVEQAGYYELILHLLKTLKRTLMNTVILKHTQFIRLFLVHDYRIYNAIVEKKHALHSVTLNAHKALTDLYYSLKGDSMWIDKLCVEGFYQSTVYSSMLQLDHSNGMLGIDVGGMRRLSNELRRGSLTGLYLIDINIEGKKPTPLN